MCELLNAERLLQFYDYNREKATSDGAEQDFLNAESILEKDRIGRYDEIMGRSFESKKQDAPFVVFDFSANGICSNVAQG